jgi:hypothetical protein
MNPSDEAIASVRAAIAKSFASDDLAKAGISTATGLNAYDLRGAAMLQIPVLTPLREKLGRVRRASPGLACHWKVIRSMLGSGIDSMGYIPEGQRSGVKSINVTDAFSTYTTLGEEGRVTDQAVLSQLPEQDVLATDNMLTLWKLMQKEENSLLAGNRSIKLGTPAAPVLSAPTTAGATVAAAATYVCVVALTNEGFQVASLANGVPTATTVTGADGQTYTVNGGSSNKSAIATVTPTSGQGVGMTVTPIPGAVGYAWFVGASNAAGSLYLQALTTLNSFLLTTSFVTTTQVASAVTQDSSYNDGTQAGSNPVAAYDGLMTSTMISGSGAYYYAMPTGTAGTGTALTSTLTGGVVEIENLILSMWNMNKVQVDVLYMSANTLRAVTKAITTGNSGNLVHIYGDADANRTKLVGGNRIKAYSSPVGSPYGGDDISMMIHPNLPDGIIVGWASQLPIHYRNNETPAVAEILTRQDYFGIEWPKKTRATEYGVYADQCLAVYAPWAMGVITNIAV